MKDMNALITRINELYHKSKTKEGLTEEEKKEQLYLRKRYLASIRSNIRGQLDAIDVVNRDGSVTNLGEERAKERQAKSEQMAARKKTCRQELIKRRDMTLMKEREEWDKMLRARLASSPEYTRAKVLFSYVSFGAEADTGWIIRHALEEGKAVYVPTVQDREHMEFYRISSLSELFRNKMGILEPIPSEDTRFVPERDIKEHKDLFANALMLIPGVGFDREGSRLGYGRGYFDRYLRELRKTLHEADEYSFTFLGVCYQNQICLHIPVEEFDEPVDGICTENEWIRIRNTGEGA